MHQPNFCSFTVEAQFLQTFHIRQISLFLSKMPVIPDCSGSIEVEIAKTRQTINPGFGFESMAKPGFGFEVMAKPGFWVLVSGLEPIQFSDFHLNK